MSKPETTKLYMCGTAWVHEMTPDNAGQIEVFTSKEALVAEMDCCPDCGVVEFDVPLGRWVIPRSANPKYWTAAEVMAREAVYIPLGEALAAQAEDAAGLEDAIASAEWALGILKEKRRRKKDDEV